jgi:phage-related protein
MNIGKFFKNIGKSCEKAIKNIGHDIQKGAKGFGHVMTSAARLDFKGMAAGMKEISHAAMDAGRNLLMLTPVALAANTLLDGALDKIMGKLQSKVEQVMDKVVDSTANNLASVKDGLQHVGHGMITGNINEIGAGFASTVVGVASAAGDFTPAGIMRNTAMAAVEVGVETAVHG